MTKSQIIERILNPGVVAIIRADSSEQLIDASAALLAGGVACLLAFAVVERRVRDPMFRLELFRIRAFTFGTLSTFLSAVDWAMNEERPVVVTGPGLLDVAAWRQKESLTVHLVNLTNPMTMKGPFREFVPVGPLTVKLRLPEGSRPRRVQLLVAETIARVEEAGGTLIVSVPSVRDHEVVAVDVA